MPHVGISADSATRLDDAGSTIERSTHHRVAWLARESSKPSKEPIERWTIHASNNWSAEHMHDSTERIGAKLTKEFAEITGIYAEPA